MHRTTQRMRALAPLTTTLIVALLGAGMAVAPRVAASPGSALRIVDAAGNPPVVNEGGRVALRVVDGSGNRVSASSWSSDNKAIGKVKRTNGLLRGRNFGFATVTARTSRGPVSGFVVCARLRRQNGAMTQGDTKTDTGGNVYLSSPVRHVLYRATAVAAEVFAGATDESGYREGTGGGVRFNGPSGIGVDNRAEGGLYVADAANHCIRKIDFRGRSSLAAGTPGFDGTMHGDENPISEAVLNGPRGVASVGANLYVTDTNNHCVWYVDVRRQVVELVAGEPGEPGNANGQGRQARFDRPSGITVNTRQNLLAVADTGNNVVKLIEIVPRPGTSGGVIGNVTTLGLSSSSRYADILDTLDKDRGSDAILFDQPDSVSLDGLDNVYVIDNQTASVVTRGIDFVERVNLAQPGTLGDPASVTVRRTQAFVLDEAATTETSAVNVVEVGPPTIATLSDDVDRLEGGKVVVITGTNFARESTLTLGDTAVTNYRVDSSTQITFTVPAQSAPGGRTLTVLTRGGSAQIRFTVVSKPIADLVNGEITTIAGGVAFLGDGRPAIAAEITTPTELIFDSSGSLIVSDTNRDRVRRIDALTGLTYTIAGTGLFGYDGESLPAIASRLFGPAGIALDGVGNLIIGDGVNARIRRVDVATGQLTTIAGNGVFGYNGDNRPALTAAMKYPSYLIVDSAGGVVFSDSFNHRIRRIDPVSGQISTVVGTGTNGFNGDGRSAATTSVSFPKGLVLAPDGGLVFVDSGNNRVRKVDAMTGRVSTIAGSGVRGFSGDGGQASNAQLSFPGDVAVDGPGNLFVTDNANGRVRRIDVSSGVISTVAGSGNDAYDGDNKPAVAAGLTPVGVAIDAVGALFVSDGVNARIRRVDPDTGLISTFAGMGRQGFEGDGSRAVGAALAQVTQIAVDSRGDVLICESAGNRILRLDASLGTLVLVAGTGEPGFSGDGGPASSARLNSPRSVSIDRNGDVYVADCFNHRIRKIESNSGIISTIAGTGDPDFNGDGIPATSAHLAFPAGIAFDGDGNLFIADTNNSRIRKIDVVTSEISTVAGDGGFGYDGEGNVATSTSLSGPDTVAIDETGNIYIADTLNNRVRRVDKATGKLFTVAGVIQSGYGGDGGPGINATLSEPSGVVVDGAGNVFIADRGNGRVRRVDGVTGIIDTVAGSAALGYAGDGGPAAMASFATVFGVAFDTEGNLYVADSFFSAVRVVKGLGVVRKD